MTDHRLAYFFLLVLLTACRPQPGTTPNSSATESAAPGPAHFEAADALLELYKSAADYYSYHLSLSPTGMKLPCQLPQTQDWTPSGSPCDQKDGKFEADHLLWSGDTWAALDFQQNDSHYAAYKFESSGTLEKTRGVIRARFDSDCDGEWEEISVPLTPEKTDGASLCELVPEPPNYAVLKDWSDRGNPVTETPIIPEIKPEDRTAVGEAIDEIFRLLKGASLFLVMPRLNPKTGQKVPCHFPESTDWTPAGSPCGHPGNRFPVQSKVWQHPSWQALDFDMKYPHHASYRLVSKGSLADAELTIMARVDTDCDGIFEVYSQAVEASADASLAECSIRSPPAPFSKPRIPYNIEKLNRMLPKDPEHRLSAAKVESIDHLDILGKRCLDYLTSTQREPADSPKRCTFPPSTDWTPAGSPCGDGVPLFRPDPSTWDHPSWKVLRFAMLDPHFVAYKIESSGSEENARVIIHSRSDANCDGEWELGGRIVEGSYDAEFGFCGLESIKRLQRSR